MNQLTRLRTSYRFSILSILVLFAIFATGCAGVLRVRPVGAPLQSRTFNYSPVEVPLAPLRSHTTVELLSYFQGPGAPTNVSVFAKSGISLDCATASVYCVPSEYSTIALAVAAATHAGDIIWISAGTYIEAVTAGSSGTAGNTITYLANGAVTICSITFSSKSYIRLVGLKIAPATGGCSSSDGVIATGTNTGLEFWDVNVDIGGLAQKGYRLFNSDLTQAMFSTIVMGGSIKNVSTSAGSQVAINIQGNNNYVGYVLIDNVGYIGIGPSGSDNRFININISNLLEIGSDHPDGWFAQSNSGFNLPLQRNLFESLFDIGTASAPNNKWHHMDNTSNGTWANNVFRQCVSTNLGSGVYSVYSDTTANTGVHFYNSTHVKNTRASSTVTVSGNFGNNNTATLTASINNDLLWEAWGASATAYNGWGVQNIATVTADYNLAYGPTVTTFSTPWTSQAHEISNVDPLLTDIAAYDFTLSSTSSSAYHAGGPLTTATSCSGSVLNVASGGGGLFIAPNSSGLPQYSGLLVPGDTLTVGTSTTRTVVSISGDAITVDSSLTCSNGDNVYWGSTNTPDIGAYPRRANGYTLSATRSQSGSTVTITPNDTFLARFAVVYENSMPKCIADASNGWACTVGTGVVTAFIYPRYPSQTQRVAIP